MTTSQNFQFRIAFIALVIALASPLFGANEISLPEDNFNLLEEEGAELPEGTEIMLEIFEEVRSDEVEVGDIVKLSVYESVLVDGQKIAIDEFHSAIGEVTAVRRAGIYGRSGFIEIKPISVKAVDGQVIPVRGTQTYRFGRGRKGMAYGASIAIPVVGVLMHTPVLAIAGIAGLFIRGKEAVIEENTLIKAKISKDVRIRI